MPTEPSSLDPAKLSTADASYFLSNVFRGLYTYDDEKGLVPEGARDCRFETHLRLRCRLKARWWSDGTRVIAEDYVRAFRRLVGPEAKSLSVELLKSVKNASAIHGGKKPVTEFGIRSVNKDELVIEFDEPDPEFIFKLTSSVLVPVKSADFPAREESKSVIVNGPYRVTRWTVGRRIYLEPNPHFEPRIKNRPPVEILLIDDDQTALNLYERGELTFLRRLPITSVAEYRNRRDFVQIPVLRFDYIGFGEDLSQEPDLRRALSLALDFAELKQILGSSGMPGCAGLRRALFAEVPCLKFDLVKAKASLAKVKDPLRFRKLRLTFSKLGGDDVKRAAEWFQAQWRKNLGLSVGLQQLEQGVQLQTLRNHPPALYRKGLHPERPTCLATLEVFAQGGADNFLKIEDPIFERIVTDLRKLLLRPDRGRNLAGERRSCTRAVQRLLDETRLIPLGRIHFTLLASPRFRNWSLNEMNQLDLTRLEALP